MAITLNAKAYNFAGFNNVSQSVYKYTGGGLPSSFSYLTSKVNTGTGKADSTARWNLSVPHVATADSACGCEGTVLGTDYVRIELSVAPITTAAERTDLWTRLRDLVASAEFKASVESLTQPSA